MSFKDNFTREEGKDNLEYDDSAFHTFAATILLCILVPLVWNIIKRCFVSRDLMDETKYQNCQCSICKTKLTNHYDKIKANNLNFKFYFMIFCAISIGFALNYSYTQMLKHNSEIKNFGPHEILEVSQDATDKEIKKAYRYIIKLYY